MKPVRDCVEELAAGRERGMLRNTAWGRDIAVPKGDKGKEFTGKKGYGVDHIFHKRLLHGLTEDEAAFATVCALNAASSVKNPERTQNNKILFDRFGVRAVVAEDAESGNPIITGFILGTNGKNKAVDADAALNARQFYALDELRRIQQVGAALKKAVARFEDIVNKNPHDWENVVSYEVEMLKIKQNARQDGTYMKAPNGEKTKLSERQWAAVRTEAFKDWFGDWERDPENASKVVDENGEPMVVYHGTQRDFGNVFRDPEEDKDWRGQYDMNYAEDTYWFADHAFTAQTYQSPPFLDPKKNYVQTAKRPRNKTPLAAEDVEYTFYKRTFDRRDWPVDTPVSAEEALKKDGTLKEGRGRTSYYANMQLKPGRKTPQGYEGLTGRIMQFNTAGFHGKVPRTLEEALDWWNRGIAKDEMPLPQESRLYEVFLNVRNPLIIDEHGKKFREMGRKAFRAKNTGHDGLIAEDVRDPGSYPDEISNGKSIAVFKPEQIKSATENRGTYSSRHADISFSVIGPRAKTFSKYVDKAFLGRDDGKMRAEIDASQARLKGAWKSFSEDDLVNYKKRNNFSLTAFSVTDEHAKLTIREASAAVVKTAELLRAEAKKHGGKIYVRWTEDPRRDTRRGGVSYNHATGQAEAGLSVLTINAEDSPSEIAYAIAEYGYIFLIAGAPHRAWVFTGDELQVRGSDGEPLIANQKSLGYIDLGRMNIIMRGAANIVSTKRGSRERAESPARSRSSL
ncbi:MAG: DUF6098 family protein [Akkermansiaceae bacterium]|nr:DUF6098 family protein [Akkermansiaceae bacterium]